MDVKLKEKRDYSRCSIDAPCVLIKDGNEFPCIVHDISERGISFLFKNDKKLIPIFDKDAVFSFQFVDSFDFGSEKLEMIMTSRATVRNKRRNGNNYIYGCYVADEKYKNYVEKRKFANFLRFMSRTG